MVEPTVVAAAGAGFLAGVMGGVHCTAMCGGIAGAIPLKTVPAGGASSNALPRAFERSLAFNAGRIISYTLAGALAGGISSLAFVIHDTFVVRGTLFAAANLMLVALGLYLAGVWNGITVLERGGTFIWRRIQPFAAALLRSPSLLHTVGLGALWGWIPCGLVYSMLVTALASRSPAHGALIMFAFGIGTLPNLLALGLAAGHISRYLRERAVRVAAGTIIAGFGLFGLWRLPTLSRLDGWGELCDSALSGVRSFFGL